MVISTEKGDPTVSTEAAARREKPQLRLPHGVAPASSNRFDSRWPAGSIRRQTEIAGERRRSPPGDGGDDGEIKEVRAMLMDNLSELKGRMDLFVSRMAFNEEPPPPPPPPTTTETATAEAEAVDTALPWKLRPRKAARDDRSGSPAEELRSEVPRRGQRRQRQRRRKFAVALSPEEIQEDVFSMTGSMPRRRPKKRVKTVQNQLDALFPGLWLTEVTADMYKVAG